MLPGDSHPMKIAGILELSQVRMKECQTISLYKKILIYIKK